MIVRGQNHVGKLVSATNTRNIPNGLARDVGGLAFFLLLSAAVAFAGSVVTTPALPGWHANLTKPPFNPPNAVFAPVWTTLFALMAVAAWMVWRRGPAGLALTFHAVQLALNLAWSTLFFGLHAPGLALLEIGALILAVAGTIIAFWRVRPGAGALLVPYLLWVGFAAVLNFELWRLNQ